MVRACSFDPYMMMMMKGFRYVEGTLRDDDGDSVDADEEESLHRKFLES